MINLKILMGDYPGLSKWAKCNHKALYKREIGWPKSEIRGCHTTDIEDGGKDHETRYAGSFYLALCNS